MANDNGPIRQILMGQESVFGTETTAYHEVYADGMPTVQDNFARKLIRVQNGTYTGATLKAVGPRHSLLSFRVPLLYDAAGYILTHLLGFPQSSSIGSGANRHIWLFPMPVSSSTWASASALVYNNVRWVKLLAGRINTARIDFSAVDNPMVDVSYLFRASNGDDTTNIAVPATYDSPNHYNSVISAPHLQVNMNDAIADLIKGTFNVDNKLVPFFTARRSNAMRRQKRNGLSDFGFDLLFDWIDYAGSVKEKYDTDLDLGRIDAEWLSTEIAGTTGSVPARFMISAKNLIIENSDEPEDQGESAVHATGMGDYRAAITGHPACVSSFLLENNIGTYAANA